MATTKSASRTRVSATKPTVLQDPNVEYFDLPNTQKNQQLLADWAEMKANKSYWEGREKDLKAQIDELTGYKSLDKKKGEKLFVRLAGAIRLKIGWAERSDVDRDLLMQGFPEAYQATKTTTTYATVSAA